MKQKKLTAILAIFGASVLISCSSNDDNAVTAAGGLPVGNKALLIVRRNRQTLWGGHTAANQKTCC